MSRPTLLDCFCKAGGATKGYMDAGFLVFGVDIEPQPRYVGHGFCQADALDFIRDHGWRFDVIAASPQCHASTTASNRWRGKGTKADTHVNLIGPTREALLRTGKPYVIENVPGASRSLLSPVVYRGGAFWLRVERPRLFESNVRLSPPTRVPVRDPVGVYGKADGRRLTQHPRADGSHQYAARSIEEAADAMGGLHWMNERELMESIPPAYTRHIGEQLIRKCFPNRT